jgi:hypothetical protein
MEGLLLGLDLCDAYTRISCFQGDKLDVEHVALSGDNEYRIPTVICKKKNRNEWFIGEAAYEHMLIGDGVFEDKLIRNVEKDGISTIDGRRYKASELLQFFLSRILGIAINAYKANKIGCLVITMSNINKKLANKLVECLTQIGVERSCIHIISHAQSYMYYLVSQRKELRNNMAALYDMSDERFCYYELRNLQGSRPQRLEIRGEDLEESMSIEILNQESTAKIADRVLTACSERLMAKKICTTVFLTGRGFEDNCEWAENFIKSVGNKRRLFVVPGLFAMGAAVKAYDIATKGKSYPYISVCNGCIGHNISIKVQDGIKENKLVLVSEGENWYDVNSTVEVIINGVEGIDFEIINPITRQKKNIRVSLSALPRRSIRTTRIKIDVCFESSQYMKIKVFDLGFGDIFPKSDVVIKEYVQI